MSSRREFLQTSGALAVCFSLPACSKTAPLATGKAVLGNRLVLHAGGHVELMLGKVEIGQGIGTALAQIAAEELDVSFDRIKLMPVTTDYSPDESYTFSSISIQQSGPPTRKAAAAARAYLLQSAAVQLSVQVDSLRVIDGAIQLRDGTSQSSYWELIGDAQINIDVPEEQVQKSVDDYSVVGTSQQRIDIPAKVFGDASYLQDLRLPNMVHARVVRPYGERAVIESFDATTVEQLPGVLKVVRDGDFVAVVAKREGQARNAAAALRDSITWTLPGDMPDESGIHDWLKTTDSRSEPVTNLQSSVGNENVETVSAIYQRAYQAHASISPSAAIARFDEGKLTVWSHAQGMYPLRAAIAYVLNLDSDDVRCIHYEASGCYGHNGADDAACDAAAIAVNYPGKPVRLQWERADEMAWEPYGSAMHIEIDANIDDAGDINGWKYDVWSCTHSGRPRNGESAGNLIYANHKPDPIPVPVARSIPQPSGGADRNAVPLYSFENVDVTKHIVTNAPIRTSALRGLGAYANVFAIESFMDELARRADVDPLDYRLRHLQDDRAVELLEQLAKMSNWYQRPPPRADDGWGLGFARFKNLSSYVGVVMRVLADADNGNIRLKQAWAVCDAGLVINPDGVRAQIEGGIVQSASWTLKEQIRFGREQKQSLDWATYPMLRFDEIPDIEVMLMDRKDQSALGVGEAAQGPTAAAIANAVFAATGQRQRSLPLTKP